MAQKDANTLSRVSSRSSVISQTKQRQRRSSQSTGRRPSISNSTGGVSRPLPPIPTIPNVKLNEEIEAIEKLVASLNVLIDEIKHEEQKPEGAISERLSEETIHKLMKHLRFKPQPMSSGLMKLCYKKGITVLMELTRILSTLIRDARNGTLQMSKVDFMSRARDITDFFELKLELSMKKAYYIQLKHDVTDAAKSHVSHGIDYTKVTARATNLTALKKQSDDHTSKIENNIDPNRENNMRSAMEFVRSTKENPNFKSKSIRLIEGLKADYKKRVQPFVPKKNVSG